MTAAAEILRQFVDINPFLAAEADFDAVSALAQQYRDLHTLDIFQNIDQTVDIVALGLSLCQNIRIQSAPRDFTRAGKIHMCK